MATSLWVIFTKLDVNKTIVINMNRVIAIEQMQEENEVLIRFKDGTNFGVYGRAADLGVYLGAEDLTL